MGRFMNMGTKQLRIYGLRDRRNSEYLIMDNGLGHVMNQNGTGSAFFETGGSGTTWLWSKRGVKYGYNGCGFSAGIRFATSIIRENIKNQRSFGRTGVGGPVVIRPTER
jgi:hypothetical protein